MGLGDGGGIIFYRVWEFVFFHVVSTVYHYGVSVAL